MMLESPPFLNWIFPVTFILCVWCQVGSDAYALNLSLWLVRADTSRPLFRLSGQHLLVTFNTTANKTPVDVIPILRSCME